MSFDISGSQEVSLSISQKLVRELKDTLHTGQIVQGVVKEAIGNNKYVLQINGINTIGQTDIPLEVGQTFFAGVREIQDKVVLHFLEKDQQAAFLQDDLVRRITIILSKMNIATDNLSLQTAVEFMKNELPLDKNNFMSFLNHLRSESIFDADDIKTAVLLNKNGLPVTAKTVGWLNDFFKGINLENILAKGTNVKEDVFQLSHIIRNIENIFSGLKGVLGKTDFSLDAGAAQQFLKDIPLQGNLTPLQIEEKLISLMRDSGLTLEHKIKESYIKILLSEGEFHNPIKNALKFIQGMDVSNKEGSSIFNYSDLRTSMEALKTVASEFNVLLKDMSLSEIKDSLKQAQFGEYASQLKTTTYSFLDKILGFFRDLEKAMNISDKTVESLPTALRSTVMELIKATQPFLNQQDRDFLKQFLDYEQRDSVLGNDAKKALNDIILKDEAGYSKMENDLKNILLKLIDKLDGFYKQSLKGVIGDSDLPKELQNADQFAKENLLQIMREQINLQKNNTDSQSFQIAVPFIEGSQLRELNLFFRRESKGESKDKKSFYTAAIFLELSNIGGVRIDLKMSGKNLECLFVSSDKEVVNLINNEKYHIEESFRKFNMEPIVRAEQRDLLNDEKKEMQEKENVIRRDFFHKIDITI